MNLRAELPAGAPLLGGDLVLAPPTVAVDESGAITGDVVKQTRQVYRNIQAALKGDGLTTRDIVRTVEYFVPAAREGYRGTAGVRREFLSRPYPASTGVMVDRLPDADALIQIEAVAWSGERRVVDTGAPLDRLTFSPGIMAGGYLFTSGVYAVDPKTNESVHTGDPPGQARYCYGLQMAVVKAAGLGEGHVVQVNEYVPEGGLTLEQSDAVRSEVFSEPLPAVSIGTVRSLIRRELAIEIDLVAVVS